MFVFLAVTLVLEEQPRRLTGEKMQAQVHNLVADTDSFGKLHNWTLVSCFWTLPYFPKLMLPHNIDLMHNEKKYG